MSSSTLGDPRIKTVAMERIKGPGTSRESDCLAAEEPLEIRVQGHSVAVVMRTPGEDRELAAGFLVTEGLVRTANEVVDISHRNACKVPALAGGAQLTQWAESGGSKAGSPGSRQSPQGGARNTATEGNVINATLRQPAGLDLKKLTRHVFSSSSCGVCSKASIEAVRQQFPPIQDEFEIELEMLLGLPALLGVGQETFQRTGGLHACALFDLTGKLLVLREDVGRHNALDKVVGWAFLQKRLPLRRHVLLLSGRASFEMMQKALAAGIPLVAAISAPSSLAVEFARANGQTLVGFLRGDRMNIYSSGGRLRRRDPAAVA